MGVKYEVEVEYKLSGNLKQQVPQLTAGTQGLASAVARTKGETRSLSDAHREASAAAKELGSAFVSAGGDAIGFFTRAVEGAGSLAMSIGKIALAAGIGAAVYGVSHLNTELEQTQLSFAAIFSANNLSRNFAEGMRDSADQIAKMKTDVKSLPGDFGQLATIMKQISPAAAQAGAAPDEIRKMSGRAMLVGSILGIDQGTVASQLAMLLAGSARATNAFGVRLGLTGAAGKAFNKESPEQRFKDLQKDFDKFGPAAEAFSHTWVANTTTLLDNVKYSLLAPATSPLFESVKKTVIGINDWFGKNESAISIFAGHLGDALSRAWERGTEIFAEWLPAIRTFAYAAYSEIAGIWQRLVPTLSRVGAIVRESLADGSALRRIESILHMYAAIKIGGAVGGAVSPMMGPAWTMLSSLWKGRGAAGGLGEAAGMGAAAEGGGASASLALGGGAALAGLTVAAAAAGGELLALTDASSAYHDQAVQAAADLTKSWGDVATSTSSIWETDLKPFFEKVGVEGTSELNKFFYGLQGILNPVKSGLISPDDSIWDALTDPENMDKNAAARRKFRLGREASFWSPNRDDSALDFTHSAASVAAGQKDKQKPGAGGNTTINNYFNISSNHDPSRIARDVVAEIAQMRRSPTQSRHVRNPASTT